MLNRFERHRGDRFAEDDRNPMNGLGNLADAMLVLAVGIMLALVINWHINVNGNAGTEIEAEQLQEVDQGDYDATSEDSLSEEEDDSSLQEKGTVYIDTKTGKMYLIEKTDE